MTKTTNLVELQNGVATTTSLQVAETFGKNHDKILRDVKKQINKIGSPDVANEMFQQKEYEVRGRQYPMYQMNKDGFTLLVMSYTDDKSMQFKLRYIQAFNEMQKQLDQQSLPMTNDEKLAVIAQGNIDLKEEVDEVKAKVKELDGNQVLSSARYEYISRIVNNKVKEYISLHDLNYKNTVGDLRKDLNHQIKVVTGVKIRRDLRDKDFDKVTELVASWTPTTATVMQLKQTELDV